MTSEKDTRRLRVGIVGCGNISEAYLKNASIFGTFGFVACADVRPEAASLRAHQFGIEALSVADIFDREDIDIILNLTIPTAHFEVSQRAIRAGKHVYSEKPLATSLSDGEALVRDAAQRGLQLCAAPDTVLGPGVQRSRRMVEAGEIGDIVTGFAVTLSRGMEHWHPNPAFFYQPGGGPLLDLGPYYIAALTTLLGPVESVQATGRIGSIERTITAPGSGGGSFTVEILTSIVALLNFSSGARITLATSWDVWRHGMRPIELHGTNGSLRTPDPNWFGGKIERAIEGADWQTASCDEDVFGAPNYLWEGERFANYRGLGLADMAAAILEGRRPRCAGDFALHTLRVMIGILSAADSGRRIAINGEFEQPQSLNEAQSGALLSRAV